MSNTPKIIPLKKNSGMSKAERKAYYAEQERLKTIGIQQEHIRSLKNFSEKEKEIGNLVKDIHSYSVGLQSDGTTVFNIYIDEEPKDYPNEFKQKKILSDTYIFDNTFVIGIDIDDLTYEADFGDYTCIPCYNNCDPEQKAQFDEHVKLGERSNSKLLIYNKNDITKVYSTPIHIWKTPISNEYWYKIVFRPNRIYLSDHSGFKIYDFELKILYFKPIESDLFGFKVDEKNWNNVWVWNVQNAREITGYYTYSGFDHSGEYREIYGDITGIESICDYIQT